MASSWQNDVLKAPEPQADPNVQQHTEDAATTNGTQFAANGTLPGVATEGTQAPAKSASERAFDDATAKRSGELTAKHGVRPRDYTGVTDGNNTAELLLREVVPQITTFLNERAAAQKLTLRFTAAELTTNFLAEGGIVALKENATEDLNGFQVAGVDTFIDRYQELKPWLHPGIMKDKVAASQETNEKNQQVTSIGSLTLVQAIWANATMYAAAKARLEKWLARHHQNIGKLTDVEQFYWSTTYYNAGEGNAEKQLAANGVHHANDKWTRPDDWQRYYTNMTYNAKMRTSTFELTRDSALDRNNFRPISATNQPAAAAEADQSIESLRAAVTDLGSGLGDYDAHIHQLEAQIAAAKGKGGDDMGQLQAQLEALKDTKRKHDTLQQQLEVLESAKRHQLEGESKSTPAVHPA